jgi:hypothetical protein
VGIEGTFLPQAALGRRALDEYELTQQYAFWSDDLARRGGRATTIRYGLPWYRIEPEPGRFVWDWTDRVVDRLDELGLETIVDLMHYGTPLWLDNEFLNHSYPQRVAEYGAQVAERYRGRLRAFTPLNEPTINAVFCGQAGTWLPHLRGRDGYLKLGRALVRGIVATHRAIAEVTCGDATFVYVEARGTSPARSRTSPTRSPSSSAAVTSCRISSSAASATSRMFHFVEWEWRESGASVESHRSRWGCTTYGQARSACWSACRPRR